MQVLLDNLELILGGFSQTLLLLLASGCGALVIGTLVAAARVSPVGILRRVAATYVTLFRNTPLLVLIILTYYGLPQLEIRFGFFTMVTMAMALYTAAFVAEALRSGVNAISVGQAEAARAIGLPFGRTMTEVVLPQAFRAVVPPMASVFIALTKNTSLASAFGITEATARMDGLLNNFPTARWELFLGIAFGYIVIVETISGVAALLERRWRTER
uniref:ABC-type amino acid transport system, permease component n=1 Tax=uncultured Nocardioidaceae bacterium TaxID=253824 RepID=A0A6J4KZ89_9ACTN|nr:MAG: ABC-type amino acid transport system, permease component [uncultured Nocardioidaceae bacterium]